MTKRFYRIDWPQGRAAPCFGVIVEDGYVVEVAPIAYKFMGAEWKRMRRWYEARGATIVEVATEEKKP